MFLRIILGIVGISLTVIFLYQHSLVLFFLGKSVKKKSLDHNISNSSCDILIPSHNEGYHLIDTIQSLCIQDSTHHIHLRILLKDNEDNSYGLLQSYLGGCQKKEVNDYTEYTYSEFCIISICCTGYKDKKDKLNAIINYTQGQYIGFLDADHIAHKDWISKSISFLQKNINYIGVQAKRGPISLLNIFQLWDSNENHILNEFYNHIINKKQGLIFFTGTTALFKKSFFEKYKFSDSITEDTYLSYDIITDGYKIGYISNTGSNEYVSPDLISYIARRRRWAYGHSDSFLSHLKKILYSPLSLLHKIQIILHGIFYIVPIGAVLLIIGIGLYLLSQYPITINNIIISISIIVSMIWSLRYNNGIKNFLFDTIISTIRCIPHIGFLSVGLLYLLNSDIYFYIISFPYSDNILGYIIIYLFLLPLIFSRYVWNKQGVLSWSQRIYLTITYPLTVFFGLYSVFMGCSDFIFAKKYWKPIKRDSKNNIILRFLNIYYKKAIIILSITGIIGSFIYLIYQEPCAKNSLLSNLKSLIINDKFLWDDSIKIEPIPSSHQLLITYQGLVNYNNNSTQQPIITLTDASNTIVQGYNTNLISNGSGLSYNIQEYIDMGFSQKTRILTIGSCKRDYIFPTSDISINSGHIMLNGETFIMKGIIPSFAQGSVNISLEQGYKQLSNIGANLVRFYHQPTNDSLYVLSNLGLLFLPQPNQSTRNNAQIYKRYEFLLLIERFKNLINNVNNNPFLFGLNIGNEIEFVQKDNIIDYIISFINTVKEQYKPKQLITYSSYKIFLKYPVDFFSINMLDSGSTYWHDIIGLLESTHKAFIASELGGFVAFYESIPETLRAYRLLSQRNILLSHGGDGGIVFQSHDNRSQPLFDGINNPLEPEQPDDNRGIRDKYNNPKSSYYIVKDIFSDITIDVITPAEELFSSQNISFTLYNKRPYPLKNISLLVNKNHRQYLNSLESGQSKIITIPANILSGENIDSMLSYTTHNGLSGYQQLTLPQRQNPTPFVIGEGRLPFQNSNSGGIIIGANLRFFLPEERSMICENNVFTGYYELKNHSPILSGKSYFSTDGNTRIPLSGRNKSYNESNIIIKSTFDSPINSEDILLLNGIGTDRIKIGTSIDTMLQSSSIQVHNYRDNIIYINKYIPTNFNGDIYISIGPRNQSKFLLDSNQDIDISLENPVIFHPKVCNFIQTKQ